VLSRWGCPHEAYDSNLSDSSYYSDSDCENAQDTDLRD
jgi:hypothetical protein